MPRGPAKPSIGAFLAAAARSQLRRYPAHLAQSLTQPPGPASAAPGPSIRLEPGAPGPAPSSGAAWAEQAAGSPLAAAWLGHATVLLRLGGLTVLTDPVFSDRIGPRVAGRTVGVPRQAPWGGGDEGGAFRERPDVILISHAHFDHLDRPTLQALAAPAAQGRAAATPPIVITARGTRRLIPRGFTRVIELDWHESVDHRGVLFTAYRPRHWGARTLWDRHRGFNSYLIESARPVPGTGVERVFFAGDTALTHAFDGMEAALAIFGIGAYEPWIHAHANPEQVWAMFSAMRARWLMPIHHSTFQLGDEHPDEPLARLLRAAGPEAGRIVGRSPGEVFVSRMP